MKLIKRVLRPFRVALGKMAILPERPYVQPELDWNASMTLIEKAARFIVNDKIPGDYLEFGVFRGDSFRKAYKAINAAFERRVTTAYNATPEDNQQRRTIWDNVRYFAFDSFQGLPELDGVDKQTTDFAAGQYSASMDEFKANVSRHGVDLKQVVCVPGWFENTCGAQTIEQHQMRKASVIWVDCDLYHSAATVLNFVTPLLQDGTVIIFDDWYAYRGNPRLGEQRAFSEWIERVEGFSFTEFHKEGTYRNSFIASSLAVE